MSGEIGPSRRDIVGLPEYPLYITTVVQSVLLTSSSTFRVRGRLLNLVGAVLRTHMVFAQDTEPLPFLGGVGRQRSRRLREKTGLKITPSTCHAHTPDRVPVWRVSPSKV